MASSTRMLVLNNAGTDVEYLKGGTTSGALSVDVVSMSGGGDASAANQTTMITSLGVIEGDTTSLDAKVTACNTGAVVVSSSALPSGASSEATLSALNGKVTACDTGSVVVSSSALPTGAALESSLSALNGKVVAVDTGAVVVSSSALPSGAASESSLSALNGKVTACDTGSVTVASSALPTGAASESSLSALSGKVSQGSDATLSSAQQVVVYGRDNGGNLDAINVDNSGHLKITTNDIDSDIPVTQVLSSQSVTTTFTSSAITKKWRGSAKMGFEFKSSSSTTYAVELLASNSNSNYFEVSSFFNTDSSDATIRYGEIDLPYKFYKIKITLTGTDTFDGHVSFM